MGCILFSPQIIDMPEQLSTKSYITLGFTIETEFLRVVEPHLHPSTSFPNFWTSAPSSSVQVKKGECPLWQAMTNDDGEGRSQFLSCTYIEVCGKKTSTSIVFWSFICAQISLSAKPEGLHRGERMKSGQQRLTESDMQFPSTWTNEEKGWLVSITIVNP